MVVTMKIRPDVLRTYQSIHTWTGITAGLVLFIAFYAGALTMFKPQITQWATPSLVNITSTPLTKIDTLIDQAIAQYPKASDGFIVNVKQEMSSLSWYEKGGSRGLRLDDNLSYAQFDDTDNIVTHASDRNALGALIDKLHRTGGIPGTLGHEDIGVLILGVDSALYFIALISGVIILLPTLVKYLLALRTHKGNKRFWLDSHNLVGVISLPFHIIIAWTAFVFAFHDPFYGGLDVVYGDKPLFEQQAKTEKHYSIDSLPSIQDYINHVNVIAPDYQVRALEFSRLSSTSPSLSIKLASTGTMMRSSQSDTINLHPYTFNVEYSTLNKVEEGVFGPLVNSFFALHFGNYAGNYGRWMYFALGLLGAFLFYSGNLLWLEKRRGKQALQPRSTRVMSSLTVGICLGSILGVVVTLLASKWLYLITVPINQFYLICYYSLFGIAIGYSFYRGAAHAAIHILYALAITCLLIPVTTVMFLMMTNNITSTFDSNTAIVDVMALVFAAVFFIAATKAKQRAYHGERDSIWAIDSIGATGASETSKPANTNHLMPSVPQVNKTECS